MLYQPSVLRRCSRCDELKPETTEYFYRGQYGFRAQCKVCHRKTPRELPPAVSIRIPDGFKICTGCFDMKPIVEFYRAKGKADGFQSQCKNCSRQMNKVSRERHIEARKKADIQYAREHKEDKRRYDERYRMRHKTRIRQYRDQYHQKHPEKRHTYLVRYRMRKARAEGSHTRADELLQLERQRLNCYYCGSKIEGSNWHPDHIIPISRGGNDWPDNIVIACPHCNTSKGAKLPHEWPEGGRLL